MTSSVPVPSVASLKAEGVELFKQTKYPAAAEKFTCAIDLNEPDTDELKAMCHHNRAAAREHIGGFSRIALIADLTGAIRLKPDYGKAYARRHRYHKESGHYREALADLFAARHLGIAMADDAMTSCLAPLVQSRREQLAAEISAAHGERHVPVKQYKPYMWRALGRDDGLLKDAHKYKAGGLRNEGTYSMALQLFIEKKYDETVELIKERMSDAGMRGAECALLAALVLAWKCSWIESGRLLHAADAFISALPDNETERKRGLRIAYHVVRLQSARSADAIHSAWRAGVCFSPSTPDLYTHAFHQLIKVGERASAAAIVCDPRADETEVVEAQRLHVSNFVASRSQHDALRWYEMKLRDRGYPAYPTWTLSTVYVSHAVFEASFVFKAARLIKLIAEREQLSTFWNEYRIYARSSPTETALALRKSIECDPLNDAACLAMVQMKYKHGDGLMTKVDSTRLLALVENALKTVDVTSTDMDGRAMDKMRLALQYHESIKAKIRAAEMVGYDAE